MKFARIVGWWVLGAIGPGNPPGAGAAPAESATPTAEEVVNLAEVSITAPGTARVSLDVRVPSPRFSYFEQKPLPNGGLLYALDFIDRYRDAIIPDLVKWAAIVYFPWRDGRERGYRQWMVLYRYNGQIYAFDPLAMGGTDRQRWATSLRWEDRQKPSALLELAQAYVEEIAPASSDIVEVPLAASEDVPGDDSSWEWEDIEAGRVEGVLPSEVGREPVDLVQTIYIHEENPNPTASGEGEFGPSPGTPRSASFRWRDLFASPDGETDFFRRAAILLQPRLSQRVVLHYRQNILFFSRVRQRVTLLLFHVGERLYVYHPDYGVWRTEATLNDIRPPFVDLAQRIPYLDKIQPERVEFLDWPKPAAAGQGQ